jgi:hypothetical protein
MMLRNNTVRIKLQHTHTREVYTAERERERAILSLYNRNIHLVYPM